jgi:hypothetical protein
MNPAPAEKAMRVQHLPCVAVGNAYAIAPWAKALVACDKTWWENHPEARAFPGEKWCAYAGGAGVQRIPPKDGINTNTNSGLLGLHYAIVRGEAKRVLLLGIDMQGSHYFGRYTNGCVNTEPSRFTFFLKQFADYQPRIPAGVTVINCSPQSALEIFQKMTFDEALELECAA